MEEPNWKRVAIAQAIDAGELCVTISRSAWERSLGRMADLRTNGSGNMVLWINEDEPPTYPVVDGTDLGKGM